MLANFSSGYDARQHTYFRIPSVTIVRSEELVGIRLSRAVGQTYRDSYTALSHKKLPG